MIGEQEERRERKEKSPHAPHVIAVVVILIIFGRNVSEKVDNQKTLYFATSFI